MCQATDRQALHTAQVLQLALEQTQVARALTAYPEKILLSKESASLQRAGGKRHGLSREF